jgi:hypothetical protein
MLQHPVPEPILARIGDITVSFALLESTIQSITGSLIRDQRIGQIITAELSFRRLRALTLALYRERHGEDNDFETLRSFMKRAENLEEQRNQITHSVWAAGDGANTVTRIKTTAKERHGIRFNFTHTTEDDLAAVADGMKVLAEDIQRFQIRLLEQGKW